MQDKHFLINNLAQKSIQTIFFFKKMEIFHGDDTVHRCLMKLRNQSQQTIPTSHLSVNVL